MFNLEQKRLNKIFFTLRSNKKAVVIGAGFSGLASASILASQGWEVVILEKNQQIFCAFFTLFHLRWIKSNYLPLFNLSFIALLIPFIISNGILTGVEFWKYPLKNLNSIEISDHIVGYNLSEISNHRLFSIPIEDFSYGYTMLLMVVTIYQYVLKNNAHENLVHTS